MNDNKSSVSQAESYREIGEFWDTHDAIDYWDATEPVEFEVDIHSETRYYALDKELAKNVQQIAGSRGITTETLLNLWVQEKVTTELISSVAR
jgi:hypothetical protein